MNKKWLLGLALLLSNTVFANSEETVAKTGSFVWADLVSSQPQESASFYKDLFGWELSASAFDDYQVFVYQGDKVAGLISQQGGNDNRPSQAQWINQIAVPSVAALMAEAKEQQAKILVPVKTVAEHELAVLADPQGGIIAVVSGKRRINANIWQWAQLFSPDTLASTAFYQHLFGIKVKPLKESVSQFHFYEKEFVVASVSKLPETMLQRARWVSFVAVDNLSILLKKIPSLEGEIIFSPHNDIYNGKLAIIADPQGAVLGLIEKEK